VRRGADRCVFCLFVCSVGGIRSRLQSLSFLPALRSFSTYVDLSGHSSSSESSTYLPTYLLGRPPNLPTYLPIFHYIYIVNCDLPTYLPTYLLSVPARLDLRRSKKNQTQCASVIPLGSRATTNVEGD
jgi:hypothetical protein